jgi:hypothetical protein
MMISARLLELTRNKDTEPCDAPNTYPLARRVLGRFAPGTRRASAPVPVIADVVSEKADAGYTLQIRERAGGCGYTL